MWFYLIKKRGLIKAILQKMNPYSNLNGVILCDVCKIRRSNNITLQQYCMIFQIYATLIKVMLLNMIDCDCLCVCVYVRACVEVFFYLLNIILIWKKNLLIYSKISFDGRKQIFLILFRKHNANIGLLNAVQLQYIIVSL